jgi:hypothetical protein
MRVINFFLLLLLGLVSVGAGFATDPPPAKSAIPSSGFSGLRFPPSEGMAIERFRMHVPADFLAVDSIAVGRYYSIPGDRMDSSPVCYAMRTYRMARVSPHSDVTETAGYAECEPSRKYSVKDAGVRETPPPR